MLLQFQLQQELVSPLMISSRQRTGAQALSLGGFMYPWPHPPIPTMDLLSKVEAWTRLGIYRLVFRYAQAFSGAHCTINKP